MSADLEFISHDLCMVAYACEIPSLLVVGPSIIRKVRHPLSLFLFPVVPVADLLLIVSIVTTPDPVPNAHHIRNKL
jgi:hypothetical protein